MSKINTAFKNGKAFITFLTGGDPSIECSKEFILAMERSGADIIEIGIPFSDPIAEGVVIQNANIRALENGATLEKIFSLVEAVRKESQVPLVFLSYLNPILHYGYNAFFSRCKNIGLDGIIIPDLPFEEHLEISAEADSNGIDLISLIAPTSEDRIKKIAENGKGFLYIVSSLGVTGMRSEIKTDLKSIIDTIREYRPNIPCAVGFGINTPDQAAAIAKVADGVIVGSAIVKIIEAHGEKAAPFIVDYVKKMKAAISS
ncbi:MAG: tryptophan synthase subunit alpha [Spirochaetaceae bacterium]|jgi:tryptophan synthase alpha chain|nr:tryptophan synthase subunit alpha [Spirochaetaceae bacterium]